MTEMDNYRLIRLVPISNENGVVLSRVRERYWDSRPAEDPDASKTSSSLMESKGREVVKATNLVFDLENVSEVLSWGNWAGCSINTIFKGIPSVLDTIPDIGHRNKS